jgi:hypothetical protein
MVKAMIFNPLVAEPIAGVVAAYSGGVPFRKAVRLKEVYGTPGGNLRTFSTCQQLFFDGARKEALPSRCRGRYRHGRAGV